VERGTLTELPGIGERIASRIEELVRTGRIELLDELRREVPPDEAGHTRDEHAHPPPASGRDPLAGRPTRRAAVLRSGWQIGRPAGECGTLQCHHESATPYAEVARSSSRA
jgi:hypothetical protein